MEEPDDDNENEGGPGEDLPAQPMAGMSTPGPTSAAQEAFLAVQRSAPAAATGPAPASAATAVTHAAGAEAPSTAGGNNETAVELPAEKPKPKPKKRPAFMAAMVTPPTGD